MVLVYVGEISLLLLETESYVPIFLQDSKLVFQIPWSRRPTPNPLNLQVIDFRCLTRMIRVTSSLGESVLQFPHQAPQSFAARFWPSDNGKSDGRVSQLQDHGNQSLPKILQHSARSMCKSCCERV